MRGTGTTTAHPRTARPWLPRSTPWPLHHATSLGDAPHSRATARVAPSLPLWHTPYGDARGAQTMPFESIYIALPTGSEIGANLKRALRANGSVKVVDRVEDAQAGFLPTGEGRDKVILSLNSAGRVREFQLRYRYSYRLVDQKLQDLAPPAEIVLTRDITYSDADVLAKDQEETLLWRDMQNDLVQQVMRRLAAAKAPVAAADAVR